MVILGRHGSRRGTRCGKHEGEHGWLFSGPARSSSCIWCIGDRVAAMCSKSHYSFWSPYRGKLKPRKQVVLCFFTSTDMRPLANTSRWQAVCRSGSSVITHTRGQCITSWSCWKWQNSIGCYHCFGKRIPFYQAYFPWNHGRNDRVGQNLGDPQGK